MLLNTTLWFEVNVVECSDEITMGKSCKFLLTPNWCDAQMTRARALRFFKFENTWWAILTRAIFAFFFSESRFMRFIRFGVESFRLVVVAYFPKIILRNRFRTIRVAFHWSIDLYHFIRVALKLTVLCSDKDHVLVFRAKADEWKYRKMKNLHQFTDGREKEKDSTNYWLIVVAK